MNLLENELIWKYFKECDYDHDHESANAHCVALNILQSMQEPIKKGERALEWAEVCWREIVIRDETYIGSAEFHPTILRLPDRFQKQECDCICHRNSGVWHNKPCDCAYNPPKPEPEKCYACEGRNDCKPGGWQPVCEFHLRNPPKPKDEVEDKIMSIVAPFVHGGDKMEKLLRELVELARGKK